MEYFKIVDVGSFDYGWSLAWVGRCQGCAPCVGGV